MRSRRLKETLKIQDHNTNNTQFRRGLFSLGVGVLDPPQPGSILAETLCSGLLRTAGGWRCVVRGRPPPSSSRRAYTPPPKPPAPPRSPASHHVSLPPYQRLFERLVTRGGGGLLASPPDLGRGQTTTGGVLNPLPFFQLEVVGSF